MNWRNLLGAFALLLGLAACGEDESSTEATPTCAAGDTLCGSSCVDVRRDSRHCGACGVTCAAGEICSDGACIASCPGSQALCDGACVDVGSSSQHCGGCGVACGVNERCDDGVCTDTCPAGQTICDGRCVDLDASADHCGACGNACGAGQVCSNGACVVSCPDGQLACDGACFQPDVSQDHCGACGNACGDGTVCMDGDCRLVCPPDTTECDGACTDLDTDRTNCGACGTVCGAGELCIEGACELRCAAGTTACDGACVDTAVDRANCGGCGTTCATGEICSEGACVLFCSGWTPDVCDGACTNLQVDTSHCGSCGNACEAGQVCSGGTCVDSCAPGSDVCAGGCTSLQHDPANCGACGTVCQAASNALPVCGAGKCDQVCTLGYGDCDRDLGEPNSNGCEAPLFVDPGNCGACGVTCPTPPHATAGCIDGACGIGQCDLGWEDCDGDPANGCEVNIAADDGNCGGCNFACGVGTSCVDGGCSTPGVADVCAGAAELVPGFNTVSWESRGLDYFTAAPSCDTGRPMGHDLVLRYTATVTGAARIHIPKGAQNRIHLVVSDRPCGDMSAEVACRSDYTNPELDVSFPVTANQTYFIYLVTANWPSSGPYVFPWPIEATVTEYPAPAGSGPGDNCDVPLTVTNGSNSLSWNVEANDYLAQPPACGFGTAQPYGPDLVLKYTATHTGAVEMFTERVSGKRAYVVVTEDACGAIGDAIACSAETTGTQTRTVFPVTAGSDYYIHLVSTMSGSSSTNALLPNPLSLQINPIDCSSIAPTVTNLSPANGTLLDTSTPTWVANLSHEARRDAGTVTITGNLGTSHTFTLPSPFVTFSTDGKQVTITPEGFLRSGEQATVVLDLVTADCGVPFAPVTWTVTAPVTPCTPGLNGMVGASLTRVPMQAIGTMFSEYYVAADDLPDGYVYLGSDSHLIRMPKSGGMFENISGTAGLNTNHLGYAMLIDGPNIYTLDTQTAAGGVRRLWRISSDGGASWEVTDVATFGTSSTDDPEDAFRAMAARDGRIYLITRETTATVNTQIWSVDPSGPLPAAGQLELAFGANAYNNCVGLAMDASSWFTVCRAGTSGSNFVALRIARTGGAITELGSLTAPLSSTQNAVSVIARDHDGDGNADYLYIQTDRESADFVCSPYGTPYLRQHFYFGSGTGNYGMGFDAAANTLWLFDDDTLEFVKVQ